MYSYKVLWYEESTDSNTGDINYEETNLQILKKIETNDGAFTVIKITFGPVPDVEVCNRAVLHVFDGNKNIIMETILVISEDESVDIYEQTGTYEKVSLEQCELIGKELHCEIYWG